MEWKEWIGLKVFIKLDDGSIFSNSIIKDYKEGFLYIVDKFGSQFNINISHIIKIEVEGTGKNGKKHI